MHASQVVVLDEAHERTVATDVLLGLLKRAVAARGSAGLRLVVMSATLDAAKLAVYFPGARAAYVSGRQYPVQVLYTRAPEESYVDATVAAVLQLHQDEGPGDILVFLTGQDEIEACQRLITERCSGSMPGVMPVIRAEDLSGVSGRASGSGARHAPGRAPGSTAEARPSSLQALPLYAALPPEAQLEVFKPAAPGVRRAILSTNIAETSVTVPGVRFVVDSGMVKARAYSARLGADCLQVVPASQAQIRQRSGRAGREGPGKAFRLFTEPAFAGLDGATPPEILRTNLSGVVLQLKALGVDDVLGFDFLDPPPQASLVRSLELLLTLGALGKDGKLTDPVGERQGPPVGKRERGERGGGGLWCWGKEGTRAEEGGRRGPGGRM